MDLFRKVPKKVSESTTKIKLAKKKFNIQNKIVEKGEFKVDLLKKFPLCLVSSAKERLYKVHTLHKGQI